VFLHGTVHDRPQRGSSLTSAATNSTDPPAWRSRSTVSAPASALTSDAMTRAPCPEKSSAVARPMPEAAPVITATLPSSP
jgi:hypothetical protein